MQYIHQKPDWPSFKWDAEKITERLAQVRHRQGRLVGRMEALGFDLQAEAVLRMLTEDVTKSSEIEGEHLDKAQVRSSIAQRLGIDIGGVLPVDRNVDGVVEMMLDATQNFARPLTKERLFAWHAALFPTGHSGMTRITVGDWRPESTGAMQVISGPYGREKVHFIAPDAARLPDEMTRFLNWFEAEQDLDGVLKAAIAHLHFVTIHPFEDGNGRIARAIADMALARSEGTAQRFYSMSGQIRADRASYYTVLEQVQKGGVEITDWLIWFLDCLGRAFDGAEAILATVLDKARVWETLKGEVLNPRQQEMINRLVDGFEGKLTSSKWAKITKTSSDTALRDINDLVGRGILARETAGGRSTSYVLSVDGQGG
ncbi:Fic family protein [Aliiroseovarius sp. KMU-50]|uniref:Fic family protein n=1 Tax=Aliiroseovarius salicola TaxID=3009082 RepID=A0ABT4W519_9RHOB|nr:Fic family protein [Aliiroseovarius sp. KMU-50]MDA5095608.1 Fic family protein [Aliiroseovarius sp. KMU-50]